MLRVGDIGTLFVVELTQTMKDGTIVPLDVSTATLKEICLKSPNETKVFPAVFAPLPCGNGLGTDGKIAYATVDGDIDRDGTWCVAAHVILPGPLDCRTSFKTFKVEQPVCP